MNTVKTVPFLPILPCGRRQLALGFPRKHGITLPLRAYFLLTSQECASLGTWTTQDLRSLQIFTLVTVLKVLLEHFVFEVQMRAFHKAHVESLVNIFRLNVNNSPQRLMRFVIWHLVCRREGGCEFVVQS
ncbi:unnamed protein product, partial [Ixodes pacificus]